jgi:hypothetical protein
MNQDCTSVAEGVERGGFGEPWQILTPGRKRCT